MSPYWLLFAFPAWMAVTHRSSLLPAYSRDNWSGYWKLMFAVLVLMVGLRHEVGADWFNYMGHIERAAYHTFSEIVLLGDPGYEFLNWVANKTGWGPYFVNTVCAVFFAWGLIAFSRLQPRAWLALTVAVPYLVVVVAMGYTRQGVAIGFAMLGLVALADRKLLRFAIFITLAALFHKSAVVLMPLAVLSVKRNRIANLLWLALFSVLLFRLFLQESVATYQHGYLEAEYQSSGAVIRVAMNAVPAGLFLWFRSRFMLSHEESGFWTAFSLIALAFVVLLQVSPSTTAVDRLALYLIPLQLLVLSRLPEILGRQNGSGNGF